MPYDFPVLYAVNTKSKNSMTNNVRSKICKYEFGKTMPIDTRLRPRAHIVFSSEADFKCRNILFIEYRVIKF